MTERKRPQKRKGKRTKKTETAPVEKTETEKFRPFGADRSESAAAGLPPVTTPREPLSNLVAAIDSDNIPGGLSDFFVSETERQANLGIGDQESGEAAPKRREVTADLLAFWVADEEYAVDIVEIQEIIKLPAITEVPRAPKAVLGITSLRGTIVPVVDLRLLLDLEKHPCSRYSRVLVLRAEGEPLGLLVDRVSSVVRFDKEAIEPVPKAMRASTGDLLQGVARDGERFLIVMNLRAVIASMEQAA